MEQEDLTRREPRPFDRFVERYWRDADASQIQTLDAYLAAFPGDAERIAAEFLALRTRSGLVAEAPGPTAPSPAARSGIDFGTGEGRYRVVRELGRGGQGSVHLAEDRQFRHREVAIKVLNVHHLSAAVIDRFRREAEAATRLSHPGLCGVLDADLTGPTPYIVMPYIEGRSLAQWIADAKRGVPIDAAPRAKQSPSPIGGIAQRPTDVETVTPRAGEASQTSRKGLIRREDRDARIRISEAVRIVESVARALHAAHESRIVHRDVKPANVMLRPSGEPVVMDLGLAHIADESLTKITLEGDVMGTPPYMSPEQWSTEGAATDRRIDVWALGVLLYEMATLERPFQGVTRQALLKEILENDPPDPRAYVADFPKDLRWILEAALEKSPDRRYATAEDLAEDLRRYQANEPIRARKVTTLGRLSRWRKRNPALSSALLAAALILVAGTVTSLVYAGRASRNAANAEDATKHAERERRSVFRLSAFQTMEDLSQEAATLWPMDPKLIPKYEDWIRRAKRLVASLDEADPETGAPSHREQLKILEARALPPTPEEMQRDRDTHPSYGELVKAQGRLADLRRQQEMRKAGRKVEEASLEGETLPTTAEELNALAWPLVDPDRTEFGQEARGLALARKAMAAATGPSSSVMMDTLGWALYATHRDDEALKGLEKAVAVGGTEGRSQREKALSRLEDLVEGWDRDGGAKLIAAGEAEILRLSGLVSSRRTWRFGEDEDRWWHVQMGKLVAEVEMFGDPGTGAIGGLSERWGWGVERRLAYTREVESKTLIAHAKEWEEAIGRVSLSERYRKGGIDGRGVTITKRLGWVPLGPDWESELEEFGDTATGEPPRRNAETGKLEIGEGTGVVFVLLPGGRFWMGAQSTDASGRNYDVEAHANESPVHEVELSGFYMSKYEMTQGQWLRLMGKNPSAYTPLHVYVRKLTLEHPVENVSWEHCTELVRRFGCRFPTESEWEYGCRGGTSSPWWSGREDLVGIANCGDASYRQWGGTGESETWDDGCGVHAPVGRFRANGFGLHDVHGNVFEWCEDRYGTYASGRAWDPMGASAPASARVVRGGGWYVDASFSRSAYRSGGRPSDLRIYLGFRPASHVTP